MPEPDPNSITIDALLADSVATADNKLWVQGGGWNLLHSPSFPFIQDRIGIAMSVGVPYSATNMTHKLRVTLHGPDGPVPLGFQLAPDGAQVAVTEMTSQFTVGRPPLVQVGDRQNIPLAVNFNRMRFDTPSAFSFHLEVDDALLSQLHFRVVALGGRPVSDP